MAVVVTTAQAALTWEVPTLWAPAEPGWAATPPQALQEVRPAPAVRPPPEARSLLGEAPPPAVQRRVELRRVVGNPVAELPRVEPPPAVEHPPVESQLWELQLGDEKPLVEPRMVEPRRVVEHLPVALRLEVNRLVVAPQPVVECPRVARELVALRRVALHLQVALLLLRVRAE